MTDDFGSRRFFDRLAIMAILIGTGLRIAHFWNRGVLSGDEAALTYNILARTYSQLTQPLELLQAAPIGFLMVEKLMVSLLGREETILRLPPLLAGVATLVLCALSVRSLLGPGVAATATLFLALSPDLIRYSCELKPYASDAAISLGLLALSVHLTRQDRLRDLWLFATVGAMAPWLSLPSIFVLAGAGGCLFSHAAIERDRRLLIGLALIVPLCVASFVFEYLLCLKVASKEPELINYWITAFAPFPPNSLADWKWYAAKAVYLFEPVVGLPARHLALAFFLAGCGLLLKRNRFLVFVMLSTVAAVLAASALRKYPFSGRLLLFLMPILILPIAVFFDEMFFRPRRWPPTLVGLTLVWLLLFEPIHLAGGRIAEDLRAEDTKARNVAMYQSMLAEYRPGDRLLISPEADWTFRCYSLRYGFAPSGIVFLAKKPEARAEWIKQVSGQVRSRSWLYSSLSQTYLPEGETKFLTKDLPTTVRLIFRRDDDVLGFSLRCYETVP